MAHIEKREVGRYRVRYRGPDGKERSKTFVLRRDARRFQSVVEEELARSMWVDPRAGRRSFSAFATAVVEPRSNVRPATSARIASYLRVQIMPAFGEVALGKITPAVGAVVDRLHGSGVGATHGTRRLPSIREFHARGRTTGPHPSVSLLLDRAPAGGQARATLSCP